MILGDRRAASYRKENIARRRRTTTTLCTAARILPDGGRTMEG
jgi:hypothetical protein